VTAAESGIAPLAVEIGEADAAELRDPGGVAGSEYLSGRLNEITWFNYDHNGGAGTQGACCSLLRLGFRPFLVLITLPALVDEIGVDRVDIGLTQEV
jgi:hypothetical protein